MKYDILIQDGLYFDGTGSPALPRNILIKDGKVERVTKDRIDPDVAEQVIDATGKWVTPGFIDSHTHYDAEVIVAPSLSESVRHGVTTVLMGSCSLSMICSEYEDASDLFTRVETVPREKVLPILKTYKNWKTPKEWVQMIQKKPLGPNVISFLGHSDLRVATMGLHRATDRSARITESEMRTMEDTLEEALDYGFLGLSTMRLKWDKIDGDREWSKSLPSTYARWREIGRLSKILRRRGRIHQGAPNAANPLQILQYLWETVGIFRSKLKTTLISMLDLKGNATMLPAAKLAAYVANLLFRGDFRWQLLPTPFTIYADGMDIVIFEEFGAGEMALDIKDQLDRNELLKDKEYRRNFRKFYSEKLSPRVWQRDFGDAIVVDCPNKTMVGRNFKDLADERNEHVVDFFLDMVVEYGRDLRWYTAIGNTNKDRLKKMIDFPYALITFSDAGAHIRNMAFYNLPLRMLKLVKESIDEGKPAMSAEKAIWRLTGEQADWFDVEAGKIREGDRADIVVLDPEALSQDLEELTWDEMENFDGLQRLVNRNPGIVEHVMINGRLAVKSGQIVEELGRETGFGQFLPSGPQDLPNLSTPIFAEAAE